MHTAQELTLARLPSGVPIRTTVHVYGEAVAADGDDAADPDRIANADGPVVYAQAAQHGREVNGAEVLRRLHERLAGGDGTFTGTLVAVPVADPLTFDRVSYTTPEALDSVNGNMNRCWPGDADGTIHERMAAALWAYVETADAVVDLHTGSPTMLTHTVYMRGDPECRALAEAFGTDLLLAEAAGDDADTEWAERDFGGKLRVAATREGIPTITPELAHSREVVEDAVAAGVAGTLDALRHVGVLAGESSDWAGTVAKNHLGRVRAADSGLFVPREDLAVGDPVAADERVGTLYDPTTYETLQVARTDRAGIAYSVAREATVTAGGTLVGVAEVLERAGDGV